MTTAPPFSTIRIGWPPMAAATSRASGSVLLVARTIGIAPAIQSVERFARGAEVVRRVIEQRPVKVRHNEKRIPVTSHGFLTLPTCYFGPSRTAARSHGPASLSPAQTRAQFGTSGGPSGSL